MADLYNLRREYLRASLLEANLPSANPWDLWELWWAEALAEELEAAAFTLCTVSADLQPKARILLLKAWQNEKFIFFSNYSSRKGIDLASNPRACMAFYWEKLERQVIILGQTEQLSREENMRYFASRPRDSQLSAWASKQSQVLLSRGDLEQAREKYVAEFAEKPIPCPPTWGGYSLTPVSIEFWQGGAHRLHDRILFRKAGAEWTFERLSP